MNTETKPGQIFALMAKIMGEVSEIGKNSKNTSQGYAFRGVDDVMAAFHTPLARNGVFFVPEVMGSSVVERQTKNGGTLIYTSVDMAFTFFAPDGSSVTARTRGEAMDSGDKSTNKAMSAALKYALLQTFCVPVESSDDSDTDTYEVNPKAAQALSRSTIDRTALGAEIVSLLRSEGQFTDKQLDGIKVKLNAMPDGEFMAKLAEVRARHEVAEEAAETYARRAS